MRVNFFAGPGAGKSTTTARVFSELKERKLSIEHVGEYVKSWAYQKRNINKWDQVYIFGKQQQYEYRYLYQGVKNIVTDSPCFLSVVYAEYYSGEGDVSQSIAKLCAEYDRDHPALNVFLYRGDKPYIQDGRYQDYAEAQKLDRFMLETLTKYGKKVVAVEYSDKQAILDLVLAAVEK